MESLLTLRVWAVAAWADGKLHSAEAAALVRLLDASTDLSADERQEAARWLTTPPALDLVEVRALRRESREGIYRAALGIVRLDRQVTAAEVAFLERLLGVPDLDPATAAKIEAEAR